MSAAAKAPSAATEPVARPVKLDKAANMEKPEKPDVDAFNAELAKREKEFNATMNELNAIRSKIDIALPNKNRDVQTPAQKRRQELIAQAQEIRSKQASGKSSRQSKLDMIKKLDEQLRSRMAEHKTARGKMAFKSVEELDTEVKRLEAKVNGGMMKLVDERKALAEISTLQKQRRNFGQLQATQAEIDKFKAHIKEVKDSMDDPEAKALSEQYSKIQAELDAIKAEQDQAYQNLSILRDQRAKLNAEQQEKFKAIRQLKDEFYAAKKAYADYEREARARARERQQAEKERIAKERRMERAQRMLAEASDPAYMDEIRRADSLLHYFDPSHVPEKMPLLANKGLSATGTRKVDDSGIKGVKLLRKEDREDEYLPAVKKAGGKKGKKRSGAATPTGDALDSAKFYNCPLSVMEDCAKMGIEPPMSLADVPGVVEKVKAKLEYWKKDRKAQTERNIEQAKKEIEQLEAEENAAAASEASPLESATSASQVEEEAVAAITDSLNKTSVNDDEVDAAKKSAETAEA